MYNITGSLIIKTDIIKAMYITLIQTDALNNLQNADTKCDKLLPLQLLS